MTFTDALSVVVVPQELRDAAQELRAAQQDSMALAPMRQVLTDADERIRAAARRASAAGMTERAIAAQLGLAQPTVHAWLDRRNPDPVPEAGIAVRAWTLHHLASATASQTMRLLGQPLPSGGPQHVVPGDCLRMAYENLTSAADLLGKSAAALDYTEVRRITAI